MRTIYLGIITALALLALSLWTENRSNAATRYTEDLADLVHMAQAVVEAEVLNTEPASAPNNPTPLTLAHLKVIKTFKGTAQAEMTVEYLGGLDGSQRVVAPGSPELVAGHRYVLLVSRFPHTENWRVVGGDAGQVELADEVAHRPGRSGFEYYVSDAKALTGFKRVNCAAMNATAFGDLLHAIVETGRPVLETAPAAAVTSAAPVQTANLLQTRQDSDKTPLGARLFITLALSTLVWFFGRRYVGSRRKNIEAACR